MSRTVLFARPHTFTVSAMKPFLEEGGFGTNGLERISGLSSPTSRTAGALISLALISAITESVEEVFSKLKSTASRVPIVFAVMLSFEKARPALERIAKQAEIQAPPEPNSTASRLIQRHFRLANQ